MNSIIMIVVMAWFEICCFLKVSQETPAPESKPETSALIQSFWQQENWQLHLFPEKSTWMGQKLLTASPRRCKYTCCKKHDTCQSPYVMSTASPTGDGEWHCFPEPVLNKSCVILGNNATKYFVYLFQMKQPFHLNIYYFYEADEDSEIDELEAATDLNDDISITIHCFSQ